MARSALTRSSKASRVEGLNELLYQLDKVIDWTQSPDLKEVFMDAAGAFLREARSRAPVGGRKDRHPGTFRDAMFISKGDPDKPDVLFGVSYKKAPHAHKVEYGTSKMPPHATIRNTVASMQSTIAGIIKEGLLRTLNAAVGGK